jgi:hypothetical protein
MQHNACGLCGPGRTDDLKMIAPIGDFHAKAAFDVTQIFVELPAKAGEPLVVVRLKGELQIVRMVGQGLSGCG